MVQPRGLEQARLHSQGRMVQPRGREENKISSEACCLAGVQLLTVTTWLR